MFEWCNREVYRKRQQYSHSRTVIRRILLELDVHVDHVYCIILTLVVSGVNVTGLLLRILPLPFMLFVCFHSILFERKDFSIDRCQLIVRAFFSSVRVQISYRLLLNIPMI